MGIETTGSTEMKPAGNSLAGEGEVCYFCRYCGQFLIFRRGHVPRRCPTMGCNRREPFGKPEERRG